MGKKVKSGKKKQNKGEYTGSRRKKHVVRGIFSRPWETAASHVIS